MFYDSHRHHSHRHAHRHHPHGGHPSGGRGSGFWGRGGGGGFARGRKLSSTDLQLVLLALLAEKPAHGYELIHTLEEKSGGFYTPSPGVIYPALTYLDEIGHVEAEAEGKRKLYRITQPGTDYLAEHREQATTLLAALERIGSRMDRVREAFGEEDSEEREEHVRAIHALKLALRKKRGCAPDEARRIAEILKQATDEIESSAQ